MNNPLLLANFLGDWGLLIILGLIGLLIFGKRLPEVGRNVGKGIVEFKKGLAGIDDDIKKPAGEAPSPENRQIASDRSASTSSTATDEELRQMREQMKAMQEELRSTRQALAQSQKPTDSH